MDGLSIFQQNNRDEQPLTRRLGEKGEFLALEFIKNIPLRIVMLNFKVPIGRNSKGVQTTGEIDIIALDGETLCFIEVKTRSVEQFGGPLSAVDLAKQRQITRTAKVYRKIFGISGNDFRYDVVTIIMGNKKRPEIKYIRSFWTEDKFRKNKWLGNDIYF